MSGGRGFRSQVGKIGKAEQEMTRSLVPISALVRKKGMGNRVFFRRKIILIDASCLQSDVNGDLCRSAG